MARKTKLTLNAVEKITTIREMMELAVFEDGDKIAYKWNGPNGVEQATYSKFVNYVTRLGAFLAYHDLADKPIACHAHNSFNWILTYFTALRSAGVFVPVDKDLPEKDFFHVLNDSGAKVLFCTEKTEKLIRDNIDKVPELEKVICFERQEHDGIFLSFDKALQEGKWLSATKYLNHSQSTTSLKLLVYTSGTTGASKGVMLTEKNLISVVVSALKSQNIGTVGLSVLPYHHTFEGVTNLLTAFHLHNCLCINESMNSILKNLKLFKPDYIFIVPAIANVMQAKILKGLQKKGLYNLLVKNIEKTNRLQKIGVDIRKVAYKPLRDIFGGHLSKIICGGAPLRPEVGEFFNNIGITFINGYGITECSPLVSVNDDKNNDCSTVGFPIPCCTVKIDEPNEEGIGEVIVKGDNVMLGYYHNPEETEKVMDNGWFYTGDYGYINKLGQLVISGRKKNIIVLNNGKNVYPEEIENYIQGIDFIQDVVVSGNINDEGDEDSLVAEVYLSEIKSSQEVLNAIRNACRPLPNYKQVSRVVVREEEFEKTTTNKIKRNQAKKNN